MDYTQPFENLLMVVIGDDNDMAAACNGTFIWRFKSSNATLDK